MIWIDSFGEIAYGFSCLRLNIQAHLVLLSLEFICVYGSLESDLCRKDEKINAVNSRWSSWCWKLSCLFCV